MDQALKKQVKKYAVMTVIMFIMALAVIKVNQVNKTQLVNRTGQTFETGKVIRILEDNIQEDGMRVGQQSVVVLYLLVLCLVGGMQGVKGALGLIFTFGAILFIYLPVVYMGYSPFWTAVFICAVTTAVTMYLIGGVSKKTVCAVAGTITGVLIAGITATVFSKLSGITGWNVSDIESLLTLYETNNIQVGGLLFSGLLISTLGAVMDVAMSISSAMKEIYDQNPDISRMQLIRAGMRVGRDMMGTDSNTLILAFAGSSVSMLIMDYAYHLPYLQIINSNNIGIALMQGLSGSFGIVLSVPATVAFAAWIYAGIK